MWAITSVSKCTGCRTCEIACSYHHKKIFSPAISSIEVGRAGQEGKFAIVLYEQQENGHIACDRCGFCLQYCPVTARDELKAVLGVKMA